MGNLSSDYPIGTKIDVVGNLELVQVIDMSNYTFAEIVNHQTEMFAAMKNFLTTNKVRAVGVNPVYSSASKMIAATLLLKDGQFGLSGIDEGGTELVSFYFVDHKLLDEQTVQERDINILLQRKNIQKMESSPLFWRLRLFFYLREPVSVLWF